MTGPNDHGIVPKARWVLDSSGTGAAPALKDSSKNALNWIPRQAELRAVAEVEDKVHGRVPLLALHWIPQRAELLSSKPHWMPQGAKSCAVTEAAAKVHGRVPRLALHWMTASGTTLLKATLDAAVS